MPFTCSFVKVGLYADQRIGELLRGLPTRQGARTDATLVTDVTEVTKRQAEQQAGISHKTAIDLQALAANPDVVQAVIDKAEADVWKPRPARRTSYAAESRQPRGGGTPHPLYGYLVRTCIAPHQARYVGMGGIDAAEAIC